MTREDTLYYIYLLGYHNSYYSGSVFIIVCNLWVLILLKITDLILSWLVKLGGLSSVHIPTRLGPWLILVVELLLDWLLVYWKILNKLIISIKVLVSSLGIARPFRDWIIERDLFLDWLKYQFIEFFWFLVFLSVCFALPYSILRLELERRAETLCRNFYRFFVPDWFQFILCFHKRFEVRIRPVWRTFPGIILWWLNTEIDLDFILHDVPLCHWWWVQWVVRRTVAHGWFVREITL